MCTFLQELLAGKEGLGLSTGGVGAQRTAEGQLARTNHVGLQVGLDQVCQSLDRRRAETGVLLLPYYHSNRSEFQPLMKLIFSRSHSRTAVQHKGTEQFPGYKRNTRWQRGDMWSEGVTVGVKES